MKSIRAAVAAAVAVFWAGSAVETVEAGRPEDVTTAITNWNAGLSAADRAAKYDKMSVSPFTFYRGTNHLFWKDFVGDPRLATYSSARTRVWVQGDQHSENFGSFDNDQGTIVYDVNDFDEAVLADYQYDLWRAATSLVLSARDNGLSTADQNAIVDAFTESYLDSIAAYAGNSAETTTLFTEANTYGKLDNFLADVADDCSRTKMLDDWTKGSPRKFILTNGKLAAPTSTERTAVTNAMPAYGTTLTGGIAYKASWFKVKDVAVRLEMGTGSLGTKRFYVLVEGAGTGQNDDRILDVKCQAKPTPYFFLGSSFQNEYNALFTNDAKRHQIACAALTKHTDDLLGWATISGKTYSFRERSPFKETFDSTTLTTRDDFEEMAEQWGAVLATAHARADRDYSAAYCNYSFDTEVDALTDGWHAEFRSLVRGVAASYADQVEDDFVTFLTNF